MRFETLGQLICAVSPMAIGVTLVFFRNAWWRWQVSQSEQRGWKTSKRNVFWDIMMIAVGIMFLLIGAFLLLKVLVSEPTGVYIFPLF